MGQPKIEMRGKKFGRLTVIEYAGTKGRRRTLWKCSCDCGNTVVVDGDHLRSGHTKSCGCINKERIAKLNYKNGFANTRLQYAYLNMKNRCLRKNHHEYSYYGARGITICDEWLGCKGFENFCVWAISNGYRDDLSIDRIDNDKGYSPDNCRWVDRFVQANNKRNNRYVKINSEIGTVANMARKYNIDYWNLLHYAKGGMNCKYPGLKIEVVKNAELQEYCKGKSDRERKLEKIACS